MSSMLIRMVLFAMGMWSSMAAGHPLTMERLALQVGQEAIDEAARVSSEIFAKCPPSNCMVVSLGRMNVLIDSFLRVRAEELRVRVPYVHEVPYQRIGDLADLEQDAQSRVLDALVPSSETLGWRKVILLRTLNRGNSMNKSLGFIADRFRKILPARKVGVAFIASAGDVEDEVVSEIAERANIAGPRIIISSDTLYQAFTFRVPRVQEGRIQIVYEDPIERYHRFSPVRVRGDAQELPFTSTGKSRELDDVLKTYYGCRRRVAA